MEKDDKYYLKLGVFYLVLTIVFLALIAKFGISAAVKISELIQKGSPSVSNNLSDVIVPPPQLSSIPEATNSATLNIWGFALANQDVDIYLNDTNIKTIRVNSEGKFEDSINLVLGLNKIFIQTKTKQGTTSAQSHIWTIFYTNTSPSLEILEPTSEKVITKTNKAEIEGKVDKTTKVTINDHLVIVDQNGLFTYNSSLQSGENKFKIICTDPAQNKTEKEITFQLQP